MGIMQLQENASFHALVLMRHRNQQDSNQAALSGVYLGILGDRQEGRHTEFLWCNVFVLLLLQNIRVELSCEVFSSTSSGQAGLSS